MIEPEGQGSLNSHPVHYGFSVSSETSRSGNQLSSSVPMRSASSPGDFISSSYRAGSSVDSSTYGLSTPSIPAIGIHFENVVSERHQRMHQRLRARSLDHQNSLINAHTTDDLTSAFELEMAIGRLPPLDVSHGMPQVTAAQRERRRESLRRSKQLREPHADMHRSPSVRAPLHDSAEQRWTELRASFPQPDPTEHSAAREIPRGTSRPYPTGSQPIRIGPPRYPSSYADSHVSE